MDVVAIIAQKGGTGKTTLALSLAVAGARAGRVVAVVDLDPQASACNWADRREADFPVIVSVQATRLPQILGAAEKQGADLLLIDTPPRAEQAALTAAKAADLILVPCRPAIYDLETVSTTIELIRLGGEKTTAVVLNGVPPRGPKRQQATEILESMGLRVCPVAFGHRVAFDHAGALGLNAQEYEPHGKASVEIELVYQFASKLINSKTRS